MSYGMADLSKVEHDEACVTYASLILKDAGAEITADKINELIANSGNEVESYWPMLFAQLFEKNDIDELIKNTTAPGSGGGGGGGAAAAGGDAGEAAPEKEEEKAEPAAVDMGGGDLFGDDDGY
mmetsp:Transcript_18376/g.37277  ORF Transcript_18376/g.37277 Transcript_18376/m.37277 type:complete len:124 (-) Transcript_18376:62-433(-)